MTGAINMGKQIPKWLKWHKQQQQLCDHDIFSINNKVAWHDQQKDHLQWED